MIVRRNPLITWFVIGWLLLFNYESLRASYLGPLLHRQLPKTPLLFPPAGWIMFYAVGDSHGFAEVRAIRQGRALTLDPHEIFRTEAIGYDNIRRNVLLEVLSRSHAPSFCRYLRWKFPQDEAFEVWYGQYDDVVHRPADPPRYQLVYRCE